MSCSSFLGLVPNTTDKVRRQDVEDSGENNGDEKKVVTLFCLGCYECGDACQPHQKAEKTLVEYERSSLILALSAHPVR